MKMGFPQFFKKVNNSLFKISEYDLAESLDPTCTIMRVMEDGSDCSSPGSLSRMTWTVAPGKQCVAALKYQILHVIEDPSLVREKRGRGDENCGDLRLGSAWCTLCAQTS